MHRVKAGDVYAVPLSDGVNALCRVLYKSSYFKHVALVGCYGTHLPSIPCSDQMKSGLLGTALYTTVQPMKISDWQFLENHELRPDETELSRRLVGGEVWLGDEHLGPAESCDKDLSEMQTYGERLFRRKLAALLAAQVPSPRPSNPADASRCR